MLLTPLQHQQHQQQPHAGAATAACYMLQVLGLAHLLLHRSTWSSTHYAYLEDLFVTAEVLY